jgi:hypothetical protein
MTLGIKYLINIGDKYWAEYHVSGCQLLSTDLVILGTW